MQPHGDGELCALINQDQIVKIQVASTNLLGTGKVKTGQLAERTCNAEEIKKLQIQLHSELKKKKIFKNQCFGQSDAYLFTHIWAHL